MLLQTGKNVESKQLHKGNIMDMQLSKDGTHFITASTDMQAKLVDTETLEVMKTYSFERPCNSAAISPLNDHVRLPEHHLPHVSYHALYHMLTSFLPISEMQAASTPALTPGPLGKLCLLAIHNRVSIGKAPAFLQMSLSQRFWALLLRIKQRKEYAELMSQKFSVLKAYRLPA